MESAANPKRSRLTLALGFAAAIPGTAALWALQSAGDPTLFRPNPGRKEVSLPRGEVNLFQVLQGIADSTGVTVCYKGDDPPETTIQLARAVEKPDLKTAAEVLKSNGYELSEAQLKGKTVSWVQKLLVPQRTKGKISRPGDSSEPPESSQLPVDRSGSAPTSDPEPQARAGGQLSLYTRESGGGARYVVAFETESRKEAEEALSLLRAHRQAKATGQSK